MEKIENEGITIWNSLLVILYFLKYVSLTRYVVLKIIKTIFFKVLAVILPWFYRFINFLHMRNKIDQICLCANNLVFVHCNEQSNYRTVFDYHILIIWYYIPHIKYVVILANIKNKALYLYWKQKKPWIRPVSNLECWRYLKQDF